MYLVITSFRAEKLAVEEKIEVIKQQLSERTVGESQLKEQCSQLQLRLTEKTNEREKVEEIKQKLITVEQECNERKMEICQMKVELKSANNSNCSLQDKVSM